MSKVSVIIPVYNRAKSIRDAVESALNQTYKDLEIIVVDDGSTDGTEDSIRDYIETSKIKYIFQENGGPGAARNAGINASKGEYIAFLDSDDLWLPEKITIQMEYLSTHRDIDVLFCSGYCLDHNQNLKLIRCGATEDQNDFFELIAAGLSCLPSAAIVSRKAMENAGLFKTEFGEDWYLWLKLAQRYKFAYIDNPLYKKRYLGSGLSDMYYNRYIDVYQNLIKECENNSFEKKKVSIFRKRIAGVAFNLARKSMTALEFNSGMSAFLLSYKLNPFYIRKLPGLLFRFGRFKIKSHKI